MVIQSIECGDGNKQDTIIISKSWKYQTDNHFSTIVNVEVWTVFQRRNGDQFSTLKLRPYFNVVCLLGGVMTAYI